jgi:hypothetical protein
MKQHNGLSPSVSRRSLLALVASGLAGCGGGGGLGGSLFAALPGTGGTGLFAQGTIVGFGSVIVNGIRFDDTAAAVQIDGLAAGSQDLRLGMVADVQGLRGADLTLGVANAIAVWSIAQGAVSQVQGGQFMVAGMLIETNAATVFDGISGTAGLVHGMRVVVWGLQSGIDGSRWTATRVALVTATSMVCTGIVTATGTLNGFALSGQSIASLRSGQLVRVQGALSSSGGSLQVDSFKLLGLQGSSLPQGEVEIEGLVTALLSGSRFMLGSVEVDASSASLAASYKVLAIGQRLEVEGIWQGGVLKAGSLGVESEEKLDEAEIEAKIEQFTSLANFVVRGQRCDATSAVISEGVVSDLKVGVKVKLRGTKAGDVLMVTTLEISD